MSEKRYYVYTLAYPDGAIFYVGKGTGYRINNHECKARKGHVSLVSNVIRSIWEQGEQVLKTKVAEHLTEQEALQREHELIGANSRTLVNAMHNAAINPFQIIKKAEEGFQRDIERAKWVSQQYAERCYPEGEREAFLTRENMRVEQRLRKQYLQQIGLERRDV